MRSGIVVIDKKKGMTSFDVCRSLRKIYKTRKVGHTGTLDPDASGVLPVCIGQATRLAEYITDSRKVYEARMIFGIDTDSQDTSGRILAEAPLPRLDQEDLEERLQDFLGEISQAVNPYSAIKYKGRPLYDYARKGESIPDLPPRQVRIDEIELLSYDGKEASFRCVTSPGTYVRTLVSDIGKAAGSLAAMSDLRRLESGGYDIRQAHALEEIAQAKNPDVFVQPMLSALKSMPQWSVDAKQAAQIRQGKKLDLDSESARSPIALSHQGELLAIGEWVEGLFQPRKVFQWEGES